MLGIPIDRVVRRDDGGLWQQRKTDGAWGLWEHSLREAFARTQALLRKDGGGTLAIIVEIAPEGEPLDVLIGTPR